MFKIIIQGKQKDKKIPKQLCKLNPGIDKIQDSTCSHVYLKDPVYRHVIQARRTKPSLPSQGEQPPSVFTFADI